ncbi:MAG: hypothetical protein KAS32_27335 [Candidatus Peribacteraceae bacterium]|nr:hypothetical protein [Candidatus Peribacteraceae bacterium]
MRIYKCGNGHTWKFPDQECPVCGDTWAMTFSTTNDNERVLKDLSDSLELLAKQVTNGL